MLGRDEIVQKARCIQDTFLLIKLHSVTSTHLTCICHTCHKIQNYDTYNGGL